MTISLQELHSIKKKKKSKYNNKRIVKKEMRFDSVLESRYFHYLELEQIEGKILYFLRQVPFHLPGGIKYLIDFQIFMADGTVRYVDVKGIVTDVCRNKMKQVVDVYPVEIEIFTKYDFKNLK